MAMIAVGVLLPGIAILPDRPTPARRLMPDLRFLPLAALVTNKVWSPQYVRLADALRGLARPK